MYGYIYKTINLVNDKIYIGQHKSSIFDPEYCGSGKYLRNAVKKYGRANFYVELLERCDTKEILDEREKYYIEVYNSRDSNVGYNIAYGGDGGDLVSCLPEKEHQRFVDLMSELNREGITGNKGKKLSAEHKRKIGEGNKGKVHSDEWKKKHDDAIRGRVPWNKGLTSDDPRVAKHIHKKGEFHHTDKTKELISEKTKGVKKPKVAEKMKGRKWMHKDDIKIMVFERDIEKYIAQGYEKGRGKIK